MYIDTHTHLYTDVFDRDCAPHQRATLGQTVDPHAEKEG